MYPNIKKAGSQVKKLREQPGCISHGHETMSERTAKILNRAIDGIKQRRVKRRAAKKRKAA